MLVEIEKIKVNDRIRKDFGNIEELANDIKENGLINPPVVTPEYELIAGERRLRAMKSLNYKQVEVRVMSVTDALHQLKLEISENENRKDFSFNEKMSWAKLLEEEYKKIARENQATSTGGDDPQLKQNFAEAGFLTNEKVANEVGFGNRETYRQAKFVSENATEEMIQKLDDGQLSINAAYKQLKDETIRLKNVNAGLQLKVNNKESEINNAVANATDKLNKQITQLNSEKSLLERKVKLNQEDSDKYNKLKSDIDFLTQQKTDLSRQITSATELAGLTVRLQNVLEKELAPIKYKRCMDILNQNDVAMQNFIDVVGIVEKWLSDMKKYLPNGNIIDVNCKEI